MSTISAIAAVARNNVIGNQGQLPWKLSDDMKHFKNTTVGKIVLMGRTTYHSLYVKPLPNRVNWVLSRDPDFAPESPDVRVFRSIEEVLAAPREIEMVVIGGAEIYRQMMPHVTRMYLTYVDADFEGDAFFPEPECVSDKTEWTTTETRLGVINEKNPFPHLFMTTERKKNPA